MDYCLGWTLGIFQGLKFPFFQTMDFTSTFGQTKCQALTNRFLFVMIFFVYLARCHIFFSETNTDTETLNISWYLLLVLVLVLCIFPDTLSEGSHSTKVS